jgi:hypothetical protein
VTLTEAGRAQAAGATREVGRNGSDAQVTQAAEILGKARRALYLLLAEEDADPDGSTRL